MTQRTPERNRALALHHANLLQDRKDIEAEILASLETLIDYPTTSDASPAAPSATDLASFRTMIRPFRVSDYDSLLEERNLAHKCAYVFCPRPYAKEIRQRGAVKITGGRHGKIIPASELRRWCSRDCAKRAMFIKVQLTETPAWERAGGLGNQIDVLDEADEQALLEQVKHLNLNSEDESIEDAMAELALERGEQKDSARQALLWKGGLVHKESSRAAEAPNPRDGELDSAIEGYAPRTSLAAHGVQGDERDTDWDLS